jgi:predicted XRE-type DNA-binding protein
MSTSSIAQRKQERDPLQKNISRVVKVLMTAHDQNQGDIATALELTQATVSHKLAGHTRWAIEDLAMLARHFGIDPWDFLMPPTNLVPGPGTAAPAASRWHSERNKATKPFAKSSLSGHMGLTPLAA